MNRPPHLHDAHQPVQSPLLTAIGNQIKSHLLGAPWLYVHIDGFISPDRSFRYIASYASKNDLHMQNFRFPYAQHDELKETFTTLYDLALNTPQSMWNKTRLIYQNDAVDNLFEFYYDPDYQWIESLDMEGREYAKLSLADELAIQAWEGLPQNHPRPWNSKKAKRKQKPTNSPLRKQA